MKKISQLLVLATAAATSACTSAQVDTFMTGLAAGAAAASSTGSYAGSPKLMIFGGQGHDTYLGCLNCSESAADSVTNSYGTYGSAYSSTSIFNSYGPYGSRYSTYSACNPDAADPPVIVDQQGNFYGRLTLNRYHAQVTTDPHLLRSLDANCS